MNHCHALLVGDRLGPYEILAPVGAGGMGEVFRARDTRLGRDVALKVLPAVFSQDGPRRARFEHEARSASALNHPNIVSIFDIGRQEETLFIITEFVDGDSLRALIRRGAMTNSKAVAIGAQIAEGLSAAHEIGVVHRDLKPENIMLTRAGRVKILDFGLAKRMEAKGQPEQSAEVSTLTEPGTVLGTVGYMSPEQARGQPVDQRSDIFSFGTILYELVSGHRPFTGEIQALVVHAILKSDPPELPASVAPALSSLILRCLEKEASRRFQSAADLAFALQTLSSLSEGANAPTGRSRMRLVALWLGTGALMAVLAAGTTWWLSRRTPPPQRQSGPIAAPSSQAPGPQFASPVEEKPGPAVARSTAKQVKESPAAHSAASTQRGAVNTIPAPVKQAPQRAVPNPVLVAPVAGTVISTPTVTFAWNAVADAQDYWLDVGTAPASGNISAGFTGGATFSKVDLTCSLTGQTVYVQVYSKVAGMDLVPGAGSRFQFSTSKLSVTPALPERDACSAYREGIRLWRLGKHSEAVAVLTEAIQLKPDYAEAYSLRCACYGLQGQQERGIQDCDEALRLNPMLAVAYSNRGFRYIGLRNYDRAIQDFHAAIRINPNFSAWHRGLADAYFYQQQSELALREYNEALRLDASDLGGLLGRANLFIRLKQYDRAVQDYSDAIRVNPSDANSYNQRGYAKDMLGDAAGAAADRRYARELAPSNKK